MSVGTLIIYVSKGDPRIGTRVFNIVNGLANTALVKYWSRNSLGGFSGGGKYPLVLLGHATGTAFSTLCGTTDEGNAYALKRELGGTLASTLKQRGLRTDTFPFCVISGCQAASRRSINGLYASVGSILDMPVVASTTPVNLGNRAGVLTSEATGSGIWMVFFPLTRQTGEVVPLDSAQCSAIRETLTDLAGWFRVH